MKRPDAIQSPRSSGSGVGFWVVAFVFTTAMAFTTVPTPLWSLYAQDGLSSLTVTIVFAVYALAVALSLLLVGHLSYWHGRRRVLLPALTLEILAGPFLAAYLGLAGPVIGLGALTQVASTRISLLVFAGLLGLAILAATPALLGRRGSHSSSQPQPTST